MPLTRLHRLEAEAERFETRCGDGTMVWRHWNSDSREDRPSVILLHGGSGSWTHWIKTIPALRDEYDVWTIDIPGLGDSAMPERPHTPQSCAKAVVAGFQNIFPPDRKARLVCFSFGCHVGTLAATEINDRLTGMIIIGTAALGLGRSNRMRPLPKEHSRMNDAERREVHRGVLEILMMSDPATIDDEAVAVQALNIEKARFRSRGFANSTDVRDGLAKVTVPIKTIWGENDIIAHPNVEACIAVLRTHHPELEHCVIEGAGHWVMYEQAEQFNEALLAFLRADP